MNRILVCGAGGFIGGHLVARLRQEKNLLVRAVDRKPPADWQQVFPEAQNLQLDLQEFAACRKAVAGCDTIYNLAADMGGMGFIERNKGLCMLSVLINTQLLRAAREAGSSRFFFASSACVYNVAKQTDPAVTALREPDAYPAMPEDGYGWEKLFSERMCHHFAEDFSIQTRVARLHNVYGPLGTFAGGREKAPAAICRKVIMAKLNGRLSIEIWGDGSQTRSFMYIDDCIAGTKMITKGAFAEPINLGSSELVSINTLVDMVEEIAGVSLQRIYDPAAPRGVNGRNSDNTLIKQVFGWEPSTPLRDGLELTYRWIYDEIVRRATTPPR